MKNWCPPVTVFLFALLIQCLYLVDSADEPTYRRPIVDAAVYHGMASRIASGTFSLNTPFYQPPLFPYSLAAVYRCTGKSMIAAKIALAVVGALTAALTLLVARLLFGRRVGTAAGIAAALYGPLVFFNSRFLPAGLATMLAMLTLWMALVAYRRRNPWLWGVAGLCLGLAAITVPTVLPATGVVAIWLLARGSRAGGPRRRGASLVLFGLGIAVAVAPVTIWNYRHSGQFCLISYNGGMNFYIGNNLHREETIASRPGFAWEDLDLLPVRHGTYRAADQDRYYWREAWMYIRANPLHFVRGILHKLRQVTNARELPRNVDVYAFREWSNLLYVLCWRVGAVGFPFGLVFPLACWGAVAALRGRPEARLPVLFALGYAATVALFFVAARYRVVMVPVLCILAARGACNVATRRGALLRVPALVLLAAAVWANTPVRAAADQTPFKAEMFNFLALGSIHAKNYKRAQAEIDRAMAVAPRYAVAWNTLGFMRLQRNRDAAALEAFQRAVELDPGYAEAWSNIAVIHEREERIEAADAAYRRALKASPATPSLHFKLGFLHFRHGDARKAVPLLKRSIELDISLYDAYAVLAWITATHPDADMRDGVQALRWISFVIRAKGTKDPMWFDTLAAAQAEIGNFEQAVAAQEMAVSLWKEAGHPDVAATARESIETYRQGHPCRDESLR